MSDNPLFDGQGIEFHHLQRLDQRKQSQQIQKLLKELAGQQKGVCPCPHCGGGVPQVGVAVCMYCRRQLYWVDGLCGATQEHATARARTKTDAARRWEETCRKWDADAPRREEAAKKEREKEREKKGHRVRMRLAGLMVGAVACLIGMMLPIAALDPSLDHDKRLNWSRPPFVIAFVVGASLLWLGTKAGFLIANRPSPKERQAKESERQAKEPERRSEAAAIQKQALRDKIKADMRAHDPNDHVSCPVCKAQCRADRLLQHYDRQHGDKR